MTTKIKQTYLYTVFALIVLMAIGIASTAIFAQDEIDPNSVTIFMENEAVTEGTNFEVQVKILPNSSGETVSAVAVDISYDSSILKLNYCDLINGFTGTCEIDTLGLISIDSTNSTGITADTDLVDLGFTAVGNPGDINILTSSNPVLGNLAGEPITNVSLVNARIRVLEAVDPPPPPPPPVGPTVEIGQATLAPGETADIPVTVTQGDTPESIGVFGGNISYDAAVVTVAECTIAAGFSGACNTNDPGIIKISAVNPTGATGDFQVATVKFNAVGANGTSTTLIGSEIELANVTGTALSDITTVDGNISIVEVTDPITLRISDASVGTGSSIDIPIEVLLNDNGATLGAVSVEVTYDASKVAVDACTLVDGATGACNTNTAGQILLTTVYPTGVSSDFNMATITFTALVPGDDQTALTLLNPDVAKSDGTRIPGTILENGTLSITGLVGDVSCNDSVDSVDALFILQFAVLLRTDIGSCPLSSPTTQLNATLGDASGNGSVDSVDALFILQCEVGIPNVFCPEG